MNKEIYEFTKKYIESVASLVIAKEIENNIIEMKKTISRLINSTYGLSRNERQEKINDVKEYCKSSNERIANYLNNPDDLKLLLREYISKTATESDLISFFNSEKRLSNKAKTSLTYSSLIFPFMNYLIKNTNTNELVIGKYLQSLLESSTIKEPKERVAENEVGIKQVYYNRSHNKTNVLELINKLNEKNSEITNEDLITLTTFVNAIKELDRDNAIILINHLNLSDVERLSQYSINQLVEQLSYLTGNESNSIPNKYLEYQNIMKNILNKDNTNIKLAHQVNKLNEINLPYEVTLNYIKLLYNKGYNLNESIIEDIISKTVTNKEQVKIMQKKMKKAYKEYETKNFATSTKDFINYYNSLYPNDNYNFTTKDKFVPLNETIFDSFTVCPGSLKAKYYMALIKDDLAEVDCVTNYNNDLEQEQKKETARETVRKANYEEIQRTCADLPEEFKNESLRSLDYFLFENVLPKNKKQVIRYINWTAEKDSELSDKLKLAKEDEARLADLKLLKEKVIVNVSSRDLSAIAEMKNIFACYCTDINMPKTKEYLEAIEEFDKIEQKMENDFIDKYGVDCIKEVIKLINDNKNVIVDGSYGLSAKNYKTVLERLGTKYPKVSQVAPKMMVKILKDEASAKIYKAELQKEQAKGNLTFNLDITDCRMIVEEYLSTSGVTVKIFVKNMGISEDKFRNMLHTLEEVDPELEKRYKDHIHDVKSERYTTILTNITSIAKSIENGVELVDGTKRPYEVLDFYLDTKLRQDDFKRLAYNSSIKSDLMKKVLKFVEDNKKSSFSPNKELEATSIININKDDDHHLVTESEKLVAFDFMHKHHIPNDFRAYRQILQRYISGEIIIRKEDSVQYKKK